MIRIFSILAGLFFAAGLAWSFLVGAYSYITEPPAKTVEHEFHQHPKEVSFASDGAFGKFDKEQLQRGFQVYKEVCASCHSLRLVAFRDLKALGYNDDEVKAIASQWATKQPTFNTTTGDRGERANTPADRVPAVYYAGRGTPPDLSLIAKARHDGGPYVYSLLTGYQAQPDELLKKFPDAKTPEGLYYNPYFANLNLAMPPPLTSEGQVTYGDGTKASVDQMAKDVSAFLIWTAEPKLEKRKQTGWPVLGFLLFATILGYMAYRNIWAGKKH